MWDICSRSGLEPVSRALAGNSSPLDYQEDHTLCFLKDLLEQTDSFLFPVDFWLLAAASATSMYFRNLIDLLYSSAWLCPHVQVTSAFLGLGVTCDVVLI